MSEITPTIKIDAKGMACPGPITELVKAYRKAKNGDIIEVIATDKGFKKDVEAWVKNTKNDLLKLEEAGDVITAYIKVVAKK
ncbi:MAG: sulfurtransferase TusA family protein [Candidatus Asgardarchaeia archaeon]